MFQACILLLVDALILQPIRLVLGTLARFCWHPPKAQDTADGGDKIRGTPSMDWDTLYDAAQLLATKLDKGVYGYGGDSMKFLGMKYFASRNELDWEAVYGLVQDDGTVRRNWRQPYTSEDNVDFSTDMLSGFLAAVYRRIAEGKLNKDEKQRLSKLWDRTTWEGCPFNFVHAATGKKSIFGRGQFWRPYWVFGCEDIIVALLWLDLGYRLTGDVKYKIMRIAMLVLNFPSLLLTCTDGQFWVKRVYAVAAHNTHSRALMFYIAHCLRPSWITRTALRQAWDRHAEYNADILLLAGLGLGILSEDAEARVRQLIYSALEKGKYDCPQDCKYLSLTGFEIKDGASMLMLPIYRGNDYVWERTPIRGDRLDDAYRERMGLDVIFPVFVHHHGG